MKRKELLDRLSPKLSGYTVLDVEADYPFGWDLTKDHTANEARKPIPAKSKTYDINADKRIASLFKPATGQPQKLRRSLERKALIIVAGLCSYDLYAPSDEDIAALLSILHVTASEMNDYANAMPSAYLSSLGAAAIRPIALILHRALWDAMCEDCGITGWSWENYQAEREERIAQYEQELKTGKSKGGKSSSKKKKQYVAKGEKTAYKRLNTALDYLQDHELLTLECMKLGELDTDEAEDFDKLKISPEFIQKKRAEAHDAYAEFFCRYALLNCKRNAAYEEMKELQVRIERESDRIFAVGKKLLEEEMRRERRKSNPPSKKAVAAKLPFANAEAARQNVVSSPLKLDGATESRRKDPFPLDLADRAVELIESGNSEEAEKLLDAEIRRHPVPPGVERLQERVEANYEALNSYKDAVLDNGFAMVGQLASIEAEYMKTEYSTDIAECALIAFIDGDEAYKLEIGKPVFGTLGQLLSMPWVGGYIPDLEDEDEWDEGCYPSDNGKLAQEIVNENTTFAYDTKLDDGSDGIQIPIKLTAAISEFAEHRFDEGLYIRKSIVKAFREMGFSERKSRDYAIIVATLQAVYDEENLYRQHCFHEPLEQTTDSVTTMAPDSAEPSQLLQDMAVQRDAAARAKKSAESESQQLRHELAELHRKQAELQRKLKQQDEEIQKRDELIELYEKSAANAEKGDADVADKTLFPFKTDLRVVLYGGFHSFHQEIEKLIPSVRIVPMASHIDVTTFRSADIIFLQINNTSHSAYWSVCETARNMEIPFYHLNYAGPKRCAMEMVKEIQKIEKKKTK